MSLADRDYMHERPTWRMTPRPHRPYAVEPRATVLASWAVIAANVFVFLLQLSAAGDLVTGLGVMQPNAVMQGQLWRLLTATYLHGGFDHILINMLVLFFFGPPLEQAWGAGRFLIVYTLGGIAGNVVLTIAGLAGILSPEILGLGASGSILTLVGAAAVMFPQARIYLYFLIPMRLRTFAIVYAAWFVYNIAGRGENYGGDICHLVGLILGAGYAFFSGPAPSVDVEGVDEDA